MTIFWRLVLAHFIADFTLQTNKVAQWKRVSRMGMMVHVIAHPLVTMALTWNYLGDVWLTFGSVALKGWMCLLFIALTHWIEDEFRVWAIRKEIVPDSTAFLAWDQAIHLLTLYLLSPRFTGGEGEPWVLVALCVVLLTHVTSVIIYFLETDAAIASQLLGPAKYRLMAERLMGAFLMALPGWFFIFGWAWIGGQLYRQFQKSQARSWIHSLASWTAMIVLGLTARFLLSK